MISDQNCARPEVNCHFIRSNLKLHNLMAKFAENGFFVFHFLAM